MLKIILDKTIPLSVLSVSLLGLLIGYLNETDELFIICLEVLVVSVVLFFVQKQIVRSWSYFFMGWAIMSLLLISTSSDHGGGMIFMSDREFLVILSSLILIVWTVLYLFYRSYKAWEKRKSIPRIFQWYASIRSSSDEIVAGYAIKAIIIAWIACLFVLTFSVDPSGYGCDQHFLYEEMYGLYFSSQYLLLFSIMLIWILLRKKYLYSYFRLNVKASFWFIVLSPLALMIDIPRKSFFCHDSVGEYMELVMMFGVAYLIYIHLIVFLRKAIELVTKRSSKK